MTLHGYFRSSASWRVRIVLAMKGLSADPAPVNLRDGEQHAEPFIRLNPQAAVPVLVTDDGQAIAQSIAIVEYLEETHPSPALLPADPPGRAAVRALMAAIACDIHPLDNLRVLRHLADPLGLDQAARDAWYCHWIARGLTAIEATLRSTAGRFCHGDGPTLADAFLVPQLGNARRMNCPLDAYPTILAIEAACAALPAFSAARPENQPDAPAAV